MSVYVPKNEREKGREVKGGKDEYLPRVADGLSSATMNAENGMS